MRLVGIDGCRAGWVVAESDACLASVQFSVVSDLHGVAADAVAGAAIVVIDIPIGLPDCGPRSADLAAREVVRPRGATVFPAPCRVALSAEAYDEACRLNAAACGKKISRQAFGILSKIREVDRLLTATAQKFVREAHPEVSFAILAGRPLRHSKKTPEGEQERLRLLRRRGLRFDLSNERLRLGRGNVQRDDIVDAAACLVTAHRIVAGVALRLPRGRPPRDSKGLRMEIMA